MVVERARFDASNDIILRVSSTKEILEECRRNPKGIRFSDLCRLCDEYFGAPRQRGTSHRVYRTPWPGDPRVNIQADRGRAKAYQVRQVVKAIDKLESGSE